MDQRALQRMQPSQSTSTTSEAGPVSTTVLVPLAISITLIALGLGLGIFCFVGYKRRQRVWWRDFERRRRIREQEAKEAEVEGPGMWEIEISDEKGLMCPEEYGADGANSGEWSRTVCPRILIWPY